MPNQTSGKSGYFQNRPPHSSIIPKIIKSSIYIQILEKLKQLYDLQVKSRFKIFRSRSNIHGNISGSDINLFPVLSSQSENNKKRGFVCIEWRTKFQYFNVSLKIDSWDKIVERDGYSVGWEISSFISSSCLLNQIQSICGTVVQIYSLIEKSHFRPKRNEKFYFT